MNACVSRANVAGATVLASNCCSTRVQHITREPTAAVLKLPRPGQYFSCNSSRVHPISQSWRSRNPGSAMASRACAISPGSVVLVVGGNGGLGLEVVKQLAESGVEVYATIRSNKAEKVEAVKPAAVITGIDVAVPEAGSKIDAALPKDKPLDVLLIIAGVFITETFDELNFQAEQKMMDVCALGPLHIVQRLLKAGRLHEGSKVALVTSEGGSIGLRTEKEGGGNYGHHMSKCAENMMGKLLAFDLKPHGVPVIMLHPGFLKTDMTEHYSKLYEEFGAITPAEAVGPLLQAIQRLTLDTTGRFIAPLGSNGLGLGVTALTDPLEPFGQLPW